MELCYFGESSGQDQTMATYKIKLVSQTNATVLIVALLAVIITIACVFFPHGTHNSGLTALLLIADMAIAWYGWQLVVVGRTEWTISETEVNVVWTRKFPLAAVEDYHLKWTDIKNIRKGFDPNYDIVYIVLNAGEEIRFIHSPITMRDDFRDCLVELYRIFGEKHKSH
jgi:hypothetical protein